MFAGGAEPLPYRCRAFGRRRKGVVCGDRLSSEFLFFSLSERFRKGCGEDEGFPDANLRASGVHVIVRVVRLTLTAPANAVRRAQVRAESPLSIRRRTVVRREVENGDRKTNYNQMEEPVRERERVSTLICVYQCEEFSQSEML